MSIEQMSVGRTSRRFRWWEIGGLLALALLSAGIIAATVAFGTHGQPTPHITIDDVTVTEGNAGTVNATFTVTLSSPPIVTATVSYATADGTATAPSDYASISGTLTFAPLITTQTVTVQVNGDPLPEATETFFVNLTSPSQAGCDDCTGQGNITNDDGSVPSLTINDVTVAESAGTANFTVTLSLTSSQTVTVNYATADGTATAPADYTNSTGTLTFAPGVTTQTVSVPIVADAFPEPNETFFVNLSNPTNASCGAGGDCQGQGTITNDDGPVPFLSINDVTVAESAGTANFTVTLSPTSGQTVTVDFATANGSATAPADYSNTTGTVTFAPGVSTQTVSVPIVDDAINEVSETFFVNLSNASNASIIDSQGQGTITDNDAQPSISIDDVTVPEGNSPSTTPAVFTVTLSAASGQTVLVEFSTANGTATAPGDYASTAGTLIFAPGTVTRTVTVTVQGDNLDEPNETFFVNLANATNATISDAQGQGTITDDDATPAVFINNVSVTEGNAGPTPATFNVTLTAASGQTVTVDYATADGTATAPSDYTSATGTVSFAPGVVTQTVSILVQGDTLDEANETFFVNLSNPTNTTCTGGDCQGQGTITDDDGPPILFINDVTVTEGNSGTTPATFTVTMSAASGQTVTVNYVTADGTATGGTDYNPAAGTITFAPGVVSQTVTVTVNSDILDEPSETFFVNLSGATNATCTSGDCQGQGTITDDDAAPTLSINDVSVIEGNSGTISAVFTVTLTGPTDQTVAVNFATANGTATTPSDYAATAGLLTFTPGQTSKQVTVTVTGDTFPETNETYTVNLTNAVNATITDAQGVGTIVNDDGTAPTLSINDVTVTEGNAGTTPATFTVTLSAASGQTVTVDYATANGTATAPADYTSTTGTVTFAPGITTQTVNVLVQGDTIDEPNETFFVNLSSPNNATISDGQGQGTITDDDAAPTLSINDVTVTEGNAGPTPATFTVTLSAASGQTVTVNFATADGTATAPADYTSATGTVTFAPGTTTQTVNVLVQGDTADEPNETFFVNLTNATNATISDAQGLGTITDDDATPSLSIGDVTMTEGNAGTTPATFTVTLSAASGQTVTVNFATADGTATAPADYTSATGTVTFAPGTTTQTVNVLVQGDTADEPNENFFVNLSGPTNATISDPQGVGTINDDDGPPSLSINDVTVVEGSSGTTNAIFTVSLLPQSAQTVTVNYTTANGTATTPADYASATGTVTFAPGETSKPVTITVVADTIDEPNENFFVNLSNSSNATISDPQGVGTITDDDAPSTSLSINDVTVTEGDSGPTPATFTVTLSAVSAQTVTVDFATANGFATAPTDYTSTTGTVTFAPGVVTQTVTVLVQGDTVYEDNETFFVNLSNPMNATISDPQGRGTITDDDPSPKAYTPLTPQRILDTRDGTGTCTPGCLGPLGADETRSIQVRGEGGVPTTGVSAVVLNVTVTEPTQASHLTVFPSDASLPNTSNLNFRPGLTVANLVKVKLGADGRVKIYNFAGSTHVIFDVAGWYSDGTTTIDSGAYTPLNPDRILDTRSDPEPVAPNETFDVQVTGQGGVPTSGVSAVALNVTAVDPESFGHLTVYPAGESQPLASNLNFGPGKTVPNMVIVKVSALGQVSVHNGSPDGAVDVIFDVAGWYNDDTIGVSGGAYEALVPDRILDTRSTTALGPGESRVFQVSGLGNVPVGAGAVVMNVTAVDPTGFGHLTIFPTGGPFPTSSNLNFEPGQTVPNLVIVKLSASGQVTVHNGSPTGTVDVLFDVAGWFSAP